MPFFADRPAGRTVGAVLHARARAAHLSIRVIMEVRGGPVIPAAARLDEIAEVEATYIYISRFASNCLFSKSPLFKVAPSDSLEPFRNL